MYTDRGQKLKAAVVRGFACVGGRDDVNQTLDRWQNGARRVQQRDQQAATGTIPVLPWNRRSKVEDHLLLEPRIHVHMVSRGVEAWFGCPTNLPVRWVAVAMVVVVFTICQDGCLARNAFPSQFGESEYVRTIRRLGDRMSRMPLPYPVYTALRGVQPLEVLQWAPTLTLGEVVGVAVDHDGDPVILHRGGRTWGPESFNDTYHMIDTTRLPESTIVKLDQYSAQAKESWGADFFLMPHGITIDPLANIWITDVGLHQVIKFSGANHHPLLELGEAGVPGVDEHHFCQPTSTAVSLAGEVFVADGYCNNRIMRFDQNGNFVSQFGHTGTKSLLNTVSSLHLPHGIALDEPLDVLCVADREAERIVCFRAGLLEPDLFGNVVSSIPEIHGRRVFDVASIGAGIMLGVGGSEAERTAGIAFAADTTEAYVMSQWRPRLGLHNPHAVAVSPDASAIYIAEMKPNTVWKFSLRRGY
ncbi:NHL repeat [Trinorchestia longiramus]|nr:NHL repeat [Trinorchestia longiramus]